MKILMRYLIILINSINFILITLQLCSCASPGKDSLPQGGEMTMAQIYEQETGLSQNADSSDSETDLTQLRDQVKEGKMGSQKVRYDSYTVRSSNEINQLFGALPNPQIPIYIFPHLVYTEGEVQPVPGYTTAFFLYKNNNFAMPSEGWK